MVQSSYQNIDPVMVQGWKPPTFRPGAIVDRSVGRQEPLVSVVIVTYNVSDLVIRCLQSVILSAVAFGLEVIVIDAGTDGSADRIRAGFPMVTVIEAPENPGFGTASNLGLRRSRGNYLLLLNPDTVIPPDALALAVADLQANPDHGIIGPKLVRADGSLDVSARRSFPTPRIALYHFLGLPRRFPKVREFGAYNLTYLDPDQPAIVDAVAGSFMMVRREALEVAGLFDESFWMYGEDLDLCLRVGKAGWKARYLPSIVVTHLKGQSSRTRPLRCTIEFYRAMHIFYRKHQASQAGVVQNFLVTAGIVVLGAIAVLRDRMRPKSHRRVS
ncbi:MAG: glycosyltransferase family 2 protein [Chloroflexi bacterium]|nr:glycosyltransferase family 2 protein [Chloroflexota bacterium]